MKINRSFAVIFSRRDIQRIQAELADIGFGVDKMNGRKQADDRWPTLSRLAETLRGE